MPSTSSAPPAADLSTLIAWYRATARDLPWRRSTFHQDYGAWGTLVSEFMLQQTPVARVIPRLEAWLGRWPTPASLAAATTADVLQQWDNLGYPRRALWLHRAAVEITTRHDGTVPRDIDSLLALSGIGDYTARAVAVFAYGDRHPVVDTNTRRVIARAVQGRSQPGPPARSDLAQMQLLLPEDRAESAVVNAAAMELGATVCTARAPRCAQCPLRDTCAWVAAGSPDTGDNRRKQATFEGSDRQARGTVLRTLRAHAPEPVPLALILDRWPDSLQRDRAIDSLVTDGLVEITGDLISLPG